MGTKAKDGEPVGGEYPLSFFACPNPQCLDFNRFDAGNLSVAERMGKAQAIRRLYCRTCGHRFSERQGSLLEDAKLPAEVVVRIVKCLGHGCSIEATADINDVDPRTVDRILERAGQRADGFHHLQRDKLKQPLEVVQLDELHGKTVVAKRESIARMPRRLRRRKKRGERGSMRPWR
jgi:transposase-like protein